MEGNILQNPGFESKTPAAKQAVERLAEKQEKTKNKLYGLSQRGKVECFERFLINSKKPSQGFDTAAPQHHHCLLLLLLSSSHFFALLLKGQDGQ